MVHRTTATSEREDDAMAGKTPRGSTVKKEAKSTLKEKREAKREKATGDFIKPRKSR
jgi:hypothetical protein